MAAKKSKAIKRSVKATTKRENPQNAASILWQMGPRMLSMLSSHDFPFAIHPWIRAAVEAIVRNISSVPWLIRTGSRKDPKTVETGPWVDLFDRPNQYLNLSDFWKVIITWLDQSGECMVIKQSRLGGVVSNEAEIPGSLSPCNGKDFEPVYDEKTKALVAWRTYAKDAGTKLEYKLWQVIYLHDPDPRNPLRGLGVQASSDLSTRADYKAMVFDEAFLDNACITGGVLTNDDGVTEEQLKDVRKAKSDEHQGASKAFKMMVLGGRGWKYTPAQESHHDMQFLEKREWTKSEILGVRGVPESEIGGEQNANMITGQGAQSRNIGFWAGCLLPRMRMIRDCFWPQLFLAPSKATIWGEFDESSIEVLKPNLVTNLAAAKDLQSLGYTVNEINERLQLGMEEQEHGDMVFIPSGLTPLDLLLTEGEGEDEAPPEEDPFSAGEEHAEEMEEGAEEGIESRLIDENRKHLEVVDPGNQILLQGDTGIRERVASLFRGRSPRRVKAWAHVVKKVMLPQEARFIRAMKRYFYALRKEQVARISKLDIGRAAGLLLNTAEGVLTEVSLDLMNGLEVLATPETLEYRDTINDILFPTNKWNPKLYKETEPVYLDVVQSATDDVFGELGGNFAFDVTDPRVIELVERRQELNLSKVNQTVRRQVARVIEKNVRQGLSVKEIQESVRKAFDFTASRALTIARTEVAGATNESRFLVMSEEGVEKHSWATANDEAVRDSHAALDGDVRVIGQPFDNGLRYPGDPSTGDPSEIINCRCVAVPEV